MADAKRPSDRRKMRALVALCAAAVLAGCGKDEPEQLGETAPASTAPGLDDPPANPPDEAPGDEPKPGDEPTVPAEAPPGDPRITRLERDAIRTVRRYVAGLDARDGAAVCELLAPAALDGFELPERRGDCAGSLEASIGYRDPRGLPVWEGATLGATRVAALGDGGRAAKVIATVATQFADRDEVSVEDDVIYLSRSQDRWLVAKPSTTLYRAVGIADIPPSVLAPPTD